jgi:hypothetical protein
MAKSLGRLATAVALAILIVLAYLGVQVVERFLRATDRRFGDDAYNVLAVALAIVAGVVFAGWFFPWLRRRWISSGFVYPDDHGIMPAVPGKGNYQNINPYGVQHLRALGPADNISAAKLRNVVRAGAEAAQWEPVHQPAQIAAPEPDPIDLHAGLPSRVEVYSAPLPRELSLPVGVDSYGQPVALGLRNRGNILIGGDPGAGKSELIGSMIAGLLRQDATGLRVQIIVADLKMVDFGNMPVLAAMPQSVAVEPEDAFAMIQALHDETERRYRMLMQANARSLDEYKKLTGNAMPHKVMFIDELADLTYDDDGRLNRAFRALSTKIARKGRAAGVTLVMATQRPDAETIPPSLRALASTKIALRVARSETSRTILGETGAERLPTVKGRCLVADNDLRVVQAYASGLEGGRFDAFLAGLPRAIQPPQPVVEIAAPTGPRPTANHQVVAPAEPVVTRKLERGRQPDAEAVALMRVLHRDHGWSMNRLCFEFYDYKDDVVLSYVRAALGIQKHATAARRHRRGARE